MRGLCHETQSLTRTGEQSPQCLVLAVLAEGSIALSIPRSTKVCEGVEDASVGRESEINTNLLSNKRNENKIKPARTGVSQLD